jgi:hypothetical protein
MLIVEVYVVASDIRCHCYCRYFNRLSYNVTSRNTIKVRHDNVHENKIETHAISDFLDSLNTIMLD